jgi:DNA-directed RNA polymerase subunit H
LLWLSWQLAQAGKIVECAGGISLVFSVGDHFLVPKHVLLSTQQAAELMKKYGLNPNQMPKILRTDSAIIDMLPKKGDIVKIVRDSPTAGKTIYYRRVV